MRSNREWFEIAPERVAAALRIAEIDNITPKVDYVEDEEAKRALNKARSKRENFNFKMVDIPVGATLTFTRDESIVCQVVDTKKILYNSATQSLTAAAQHALQTDRPIQGPLYWEYKGETLVERRLRMEQE